MAFMAFGLGSKRRIFGIFTAETIRANGPLAAVGFNGRIDIRRARLVMDPVFDIMLDVVRIATLQPHGASTETRRIERDRALGSTGAVTTDESTPTVARAAKCEAMRLPRWFKLSFVPR